MAGLSSEELCSQITKVLDDQEIDYACTVQEELAVVTWSFEEIQRSILAGSENYNRASIGVYLRKNYPTGVCGELAEEVMIVDQNNFSENVLEAYKRAERYGEEDLEMVQVQRF